MLKLLGHESAEYVAVGIVARVDHGREDWLDQTGSHVPDGEDVPIEDTQGHELNVLVLVLVVEAVLVDELLLHLLTFGQPSVSKSIQFQPNCALSV